MAQHASIGQAWPIDRTAANCRGLRHSDMIGKESRHLQPFGHVAAEQQYKRDVACNIVEEWHEIDDLAKWPAAHFPLDDCRNLFHEVVDNASPEWRQHHAAIVGVAAAIHRNNA